MGFINLNKHLNFMARVCDITGKRTCTGNNVSHANNKTRRKFYPNLIRKRFYVEELEGWFMLRISTSALRNINKNGLMPVLVKAKKEGTLASHVAAFL